MGIWFACTLFVSAFLLFLIQPLFSKMVLPLLGGTPAVWNTCLVFFQLALLAGYAYAHATTAWLGTRRQARLHALLLLVPLLALPVSLPANLAPPADASPVGWLLGLLLARVGLPFFVVATSAPLLQAWFADPRQPGARDPYFLYAASNAGSLLALLAYPLLLEPHLRLTEQNRLWAAGYVVFVLLTCGCMRLLWRAGPLTPAAIRPAAGERLPLGRRLRWVGLSLVPSSLLLGVTTYITTDLASVPLLWIVPLALYLLTFILVFAARPPFSHEGMRRALPLVVILTLLPTMSRLIGPAWLIPIHLLLFFIASMVCHGALAQDRPSPAHLTEFYFWLAAGGAAGGLLNALIAPLVFRSVAEYPLAIVLACLALLRPGEPRGGRWRDVLLPAVLALTSLVITATVRMLGAERTLAGDLVQFGLPVVLCYTFSRRPVRFALGVGLLLLVGLRAADEAERPLHTARSFFGVHRVFARAIGPERYHELVHGTTLHGRQSLDPARRCEPLSYYDREGPVGQIFGALTLPAESPRVAVVGLGTGALGCYAAPGQAWTFYEIDPAIERTARTPEYFTILRDCVPAARVVLGDARLSLQRVPDRSYGMIIVDAFGSDAIPVHLLTREAFALYLRKLAEHGVIVFHTSNHYLNLRPVVGNLAKDLHLWGVGRGRGRLTDAQFLAGASASEWVVLARRQDDLGALWQNRSWQPLRPAPRLPVWTDDYSNIFSVFRWRESIRPARPAAPADAHRTR